MFQPRLSPRNLELLFLHGLLLEENGRSLSKPRSKLHGKRKGFTLCFKSGSVKQLNNRYQQTAFDTEGLILVGFRNYNEKEYKE